MKYHLSVCVETICSQSWRLKTFGIWQFVSGSYPPSDSVSYPWSVPHRQCKNLKSRILYRLGLSPTWCI